VITRNIILRQRLRKQLSFMSEYIGKTYQILVITYNHENIIIECLDSIKKQISRYGKNKSVALTILDDFSTDRNVKVINDWLELNNDLFKNVDFKVNDQNLGLKRNVLVLRSLIKTDLYIITSGDDRFLLRHNLFDYIDYCKDKSIVLSPSFYLGQWNLRTFANTVYLYFYKSFPKYFKRVIEKIGPPIQVQGSYVNRKHLFNDRINCFILNSSWKSEDYPTWEFLFLVEDLSYDIYPYAISDYWPNKEWKSNQIYSSDKKNISLFNQLIRSSDYRKFTLGFIISLIIMLRYPKRLYILLAYFFIKFKD